MKRLTVLAAAALALNLPTAHIALADSDADIIKNAEMAAPAPVSSGATIYAMTEDGKLKTLREGSNGWWCMPNDPSTPGDDPMCGDANSFEWAAAWMGKTEPPNGKVGFMYMLLGGPAGSNTDPYAMQPPAGENWVETGPHLMVVNTKGMLAGHPGGAKPDTTKPYVMWGGTPYEHLMLPIQ
ncbi:MAG TPA: hypothetical protein VI582_03795 [Aestuariivirga sp.]|nr:hypothetical protein [Aestuariivirga sp.]